MALGAKDSPPIFGDCLPREISQQTPPCATDNPFRAAISKILGSRLSGGATEPSQPDLPLWTRPPPNPPPDLIRTRFIFCLKILTWFWLDSDPKRRISGVKIRSKSDLNQVRGRVSEGVGSRAEFTTSRHCNRCDACIVAYIAVDFRPRKCKSQWKCIASQTWFSAMHIALHKSLVLVPSTVLQSRDSHHGLQKHIASQTCIARFGELRSKGVAPRKLLILGVSTHGLQWETCLP